MISGGSPNQQELGAGKVQTRDERTGTNGDRANKAGQTSGGNQEEVRMARAKLAQLEESVREMAHDDRVLDVVPTSGKYSQNLRSVVQKLTDIRRRSKIGSISDITYTHVTIIIHLVLHFPYIQSIFPHTLC